MNEYILRPSSFNYNSSYKYASTSHPTEHAFDDDLDTYWLCNNKSLNYDKYRRTLYGFNFSEIPNNEEIAEVKIGLRYYNSKSNTKFNIFPLNTPLLNPWGSTDAEIEFDYGGLSYYSFNVTNSEVVIDSESDALSKSLDYINKNRTILLENPKKYGLCVAFNDTGESRIYDIYLKIKTITNSLIFNGSNNITSAYLGSTKLNGIYLGDKKLL